MIGGRGGGVGEFSAEIRDSGSRSGQWPRCSTRQARLLACCATYTRTNTCFPEGVHAYGHSQHAADESVLPRLRALAYEPRIKQDAEGRTRGKSKRRNGQEVEPRRGLHEQ